MTVIKICGVTQPEDAARVAAAGADYIGLNFWTGSKRYLDPRVAAGVAQAIRAAGTARVVGVFVDTSVDAIRSVLSQVELDVLQLHGDEGPADVAAIAAGIGKPLWKSVAIASEQDVVDLDRWPAEALLLDTPSVGRGGSGTTFDWELAVRARARAPEHKLVLAGGLHPGNVADAIARVGPWGVDVASGVESAPGVKDPAKVAAFVAAVRGA